MKKKYAQNYSKVTQSMFKKKKKRVMSANDLKVVEDQFDHLKSEAIKNLESNESSRGQVDTTRSALFCFENKSERLKMINMHVDQFQKKDLTKMDLNKLPQDWYFAASDEEAATTDNRDFGGH